MKIGKTLRDSDVTFERRMRDLDEQERYQAIEKRNADKSPFHRFAQQNIDKIDVMMKIADSPLAVKIYFLIIKKMNTKNALVASYQFFMDYFQTSKSSVCRAIRVLQEENILQVKRRNGITVYLLNPEVVWKGKGSAMKYCEFEGTILLTESEWNSNGEE